MNKTIIGSSALKYHGGSTLLRIAGTYPTLLEVILEQVQNCIDKDAKNIWITLNQKTNHLATRDDGDGVTIEEFDKALKSVGKTIKKGDKLGRFGLGLVAPIGKCKVYCFTSTPRENPDKYIEWTFTTEGLENMEDVRIPWKSLPNLRFGVNYTGKGISGVGWRTEARLEGITTDRFVSKVTMEMLCEGILSKYNQAMKKKGVKAIVTITSLDGARETSEIKATDFTGTPLPERIIRNEEGGDTVFRMFLTRKSRTSKSGKIFVGEVDNDFRISFPMFIRSLPAGIEFPEETVRALLSGFFEGEILSSRAKIHSSRRGFEINDSLLGLALAIQCWFEEIGSDHFIEAKEQRREERYQALGIRSMRVIEALSQDKFGKTILSVIQSFEKGTIGSQHFEKKGSESDRTGIAVSYGGTSGQKTGVTPARSKPEIEHVGHKPFVVIGPRGHHRRIVRSNSLGLNLAHEAMPGNKLWELEEATGTLILNVRHPLWVECEERSDMVLMKFQEFLIIGALTAQAMPEDWREIAKTQVEESTPPYVFALLNGDCLANRGPGRPKKEKIKKLVMSKNK
jgi:hypothetical protein